MARGPVTPSTARRRRLVALIAAVLVVLVALEIAVGPAAERARHGARLERIEIESEAVGRTLPASVVVPGGDAPGRRPLLVFLHGRGANETSDVHEDMYAALEEQGARAPIVVFPYGGESSYWHDRDGGDWGRYVTAEVIPRVVEEFDADPRRVAIGGISMGGFGALDTARLHPRRFCAVGGHSPAIYEDGADSAAGAFDDAEDFERHDVIEAAGDDPAAFAGLPVWVDTGNRDPFRPGIAAFASTMEATGKPVRVHVWPGGHDGSYWRAHWDEYMRFYAGALARCGSR